MKRKKRNWQETMVGRFPREAPDLDRRRSAAADQNGTRVVELLRRAVRVHGIGIGIGISGAEGGPGRSP